MSSRHSNASPSFFQLSSQSFPHIWFLTIIKVSCGFAHILSLCTHHYCSILCSTNLFINFSYIRPLIRRISKVLIQQEAERIVQETIESLVVPHWLSGDRCPDARTNNNANCNEFCFDASITCTLRTTVELYQVLMNLPSNVTVEIDPGPLPQS